MLRPRLALLGLAVALLPGLRLVALARADDPAPLTARAELRRRYLWIGADGTLSGVASGSTVTASVRRGAASALEQGATVGAGGALHVELRTTARLLPDEYDLVVADASRELARASFRVGTPDEAGPARDRLRSWLTIARAALRDLTEYLERAGSFHRDRLLDEAKTSGGRPGRLLVEAQRAAWGQALERFAQRFRAARMDFLPYEREVLLSPFPEAGKALSELFPALLARRDVLKASFEEALAGREAPLPEATAILDIARRSARGLGFEAGDLDAWSAGPVGVPERGKVENGRFASALGASVAVPPDWTVFDARTQEVDNPEDRLVVDGPDGIRFWLRVREQPDARSWDDLARVVETFAWEEYGDRSYKKLEGEKGERSYRLLGKCVVQGRPQRLLIVERAPLAGRRLLELRLVCPEGAWSAHESLVNQIAASFALDEKK
jgi:hypothetical protein